jgi:hypothetical protein
MRNGIHTPTIIIEISPNIASSCRRFVGNLTEQVVAEEVARECGYASSSTSDAGAKERRLRVRRMGLTGASRQVTTCP